MRHSRAIFLATTYELDELTPARRSRLQTHLVHCAACAAAAQKARRFNEFFQGFAFEPPAGFDAAVESVRGRSLRAAREQLGASRSFWAPLMRPGTLAMGVPAMAGALVLAVVLVRGGGTPSGTQVARPDRPVQEAPKAVVMDADPEAPTAARPSVAASDATVRIHRAQAPAPTQNVGFVMVREGRDVKIEWAGDRQTHRVRKGDDAATVQLAGREVVQGRTWSDPEVQPEAGSVTFYLVD